jgi:hypothetical protein
MTETTQQDTTLSEDNPIDTGELLRTAQQRDWLNICRALEAPKEDVLEQTELLFPALCWLNRKRKHGGADWDSILDLTDAELYAELGMGAADEDSEPDPKESASDTSPQPTTSESSTPNGDSPAPDSASAPDSPPASTTA